MAEVVLEVEVEDVVVEGEARRAPAPSLEGDMRDREVRLHVRKNLRANQHPHIKSGHQIRMTCVKIFLSNVQQRKRGIL